MSVALESLRARQERGSVMVLMAAALFPIMFLAAFAIDVSHWWDYSRNLQNRADAAALSAGASFGGICLGGGTGGDVRTGAQRVIGNWAQLYSGAGTGEPSGTNITQLPYTNAQVTAGTGWNLTQNGYINNTTSTTSPVVSPLTLRLGNLNNYWVVLNGNNYAEKGGTSFSMTSSGSGATFCSSDPKYDLTDPQAASAGPAVPMVDVKVSQKRLPLFFQGLPGFGSLHPNIHAHARVELQGEASSPSEPIAVSDNGYTPCVTVNFYSTADPLNPIGTAVLTKEPQPLQTSPIIWDNATVQFDSSGNPIAGTGPTQVTMPAAGTNVYVQPFLNNCSGAGEYFDDSTNSGVLLINTYGNPPTPTAGQPPVITTGGVTLNPLNCAPDSFFAVATGGCNIQVTANVAFAVANNKAKVTAVDTSNPGSPLTLTGSGTTWTPNGSNHLVIGDTSGQHLIRIDWEQNDGSITGLGTCTNNATNPCKGSFGVRAQAFGACNGCAQPDDSGPIILAQVRKDTDGVGAFGPNAYAQNSQPRLVVTLQLAGLNAAPATAGPADDAVLRYPTSGNHQTGLIDCGQGTNGSYGDYVIYAGCGPGNPYIGNPLPTLNPIYMYTRTDNSGCAPAQDGNTTGWPNGDHQDCVATIPGTRNPICPLVLRMTGEPLSAQPCNFNLTTCASTPVRPCCPANKWASGVQGGDPRAVTMIITSGVDFSAASGPQGWVPVRRFATFYITGWDSRITPQCAGNDPFPTKGKRTQDNEAVWGHWMNYSDTAGISNGQGCPVASVQPINCVPALTR